MVRSRPDGRHRPAGSDTQRPPPGRRTTPAIASSVATLTGRTNRGLVRRACAPLSRPFKQDQLSILPRQPMDYTAL